MSASVARVRGFTLIEVLVALALMSLIGTILIESLRMGGHTWQHVTREAADIDEITRAQEFLRQRLGTIYPPEPGTGLASASDSFVGETNQLEFSSTAPGSATAGLVRYQLGLSASDPRNVEIRYRPQHTAVAAAQQADWSGEPLLARASALSIQFWEDSAGASGSWVDHWQDHARLPRLIRIDVRFADQDRRFWPPLYVEPRIDTHATCVFDVVSRRCRGGV